MNEFVEMEVNVAELRDLFKNGVHHIEIATPDGFQPVVSWWDKGALPMVEVATEKGLLTRCATNHLIQAADGTWCPAAELRPNDRVTTTLGVENIRSVTACAHAEECFDFEVGHPNHRYFGDGFSSHNSGKSYIAVANIIKWCQRNGVWPVLCDTENAADRSWMAALGVDTDEAEMHKVQVATIDDLSKFLGHTMEEYKAQHGTKPYADRPKMLFLIDSLGMLITPNQDRQFMEGDQKGDLGIKAKQLTAMIRVLMAKIASQPIGLVATNHVFDSQDQYKPDSIPGGKMLEFASSVIVQMNKFLLKEDEDGNDLAKGEVAGIRSTAVVRKSRYAKPFERLRINIPYDAGMDPYSGLFDLFEKKGAITRQGNRYTYTSPVTGEILLDWRKNFRKNGWLDQIMSEWGQWETQSAKLGFDSTEGANVKEGDLDE